jgi:uncharacterized protein DUF4157
MSRSSPTKVMAPPVNRTVEARPSRVVNGPRPDDAKHSPAPETLPNQPDSTGSGHAFSKIDIHTGLPQRIQTRLVVGRPGDRYEEEADRAADLVTGSSASEQMPGLGAEPSAPLRRQSLEDEGQREDETVQAHALPGAAPKAAPGLAQQIENAGVEGQPMSTGLRGFYEGRFGHDFGSVRVHTGERAAAAAAEVGAQAFTRGQDIYFGAGYYRPETDRGRWLIAHELAHTIQQRPNVIARQTLSAPADAARSEAIEEPATSGQSIESLAADLLGTLRSGSSDGNSPARERLRALDTPTQLAVLARVRSQLPPTEHPSVSALLENALDQRTGAKPMRKPSRSTTETGQGVSAGTSPGQESAQTSITSGGVPAPRASAVEPSGARRPSDLLASVESGPAQSTAAGPGMATDDEKRSAERSFTPEQDRTVEVRSEETPSPAPVQRTAESPAEGASAPSTETAKPTAVAAANMQAAIRSATEQAGPDASMGPSASSEDEGAASQSGPPGSEKAAGQAEVAAQMTISALNDQLAELGQIRGGRVRFEAGASNFSGDPKEIARREQSESLASAFIQNVAQYVEPIIGAALNAVPQVLTSLTSAKETVSKTMTEQAAALHDGAETARKRVGAEARQARGHVAKKRGESDSATDQGAQSAENTAKTAQTSARGEIDKQAKAQADDISKIYRDADLPTRMVGINSGSKAQGAASKHAKSYLDQRNGESSILDGPIHDNRLEARADAAVKVGEGYAKSFQEAGTDQANKLPESKPEVQGKVSEISGQAKIGLDDQLKQMNEGVSAFKTSARARAGQTNNRLQSTATSSAKQAVEALNVDEEQQTANLVSQGSAQQQAMDDAVSSGLVSLTDGLTSSIGQITQSMNDFTGSAAGMEPPDPEELSPVLNDVVGQTNGAIATMGQQIQTIGPTMGATIATASDQAVKSLSDASAAARQQSGSTADALASNMQGLSRQATKGFNTLIDGDKKTAGEMGKNADQGFRDAAKASKESFGLFGDKVEENLVQGRTQLSDNLWSKQNQEKLDSDIRKYGDEAAKQVQPRWKKVLKWVVTIVVVIAVIAITIASAGSLGPVGVVLLGATLGAAAGAATTIAHNLIDGKKWSDGVAKAMIVGAIGGAFGGVGGVLVKGVGSVALKVGFEAGINVVGGIAGEVIGSVAVGETINWTGAVVGALIGAGVGAGLGIAGALKGKIRIGSAGEAPMPAPARPTVEVPAPPPGRMRSVMEKARILAPRPSPAAPKGPAASAAPETAPAPAQEPRIGFGSDREAARAAQPRPPGAQPQTERIGFGPDREAARAAQPRPPGAQPEVERIGFGPQREAARAAQPRPPGAQPEVERIGFGPDREAARAAQPRPPGAQPEVERIGFGPQREAARAAQPRPPGAQPQTERIGFGREAVREAQPRPPVSQAHPDAGTGLLADVRPPTAVRQPVTLETGPPRPGATTTGGEPVRMGGQAPEIHAMARPSGAGGQGSRTSPAPRRGKVTPIEETPPASRPAEAAPAVEPQPGGGQPGRPAAGSAEGHSPTGAGAARNEAPTPTRPASGGGKPGATKETPPPTAAPEKQAAPSKPAPEEPSLKGKPGTSDDPLVVVKIRGKNKGQYWSEGTPEYKNNAGTAKRPPNEKYVVLPKSQADNLGFRPSGTQPRTTITPRTVGGKQIESSGAGRGTHPITARTSRKPATGRRRADQPLEMTNPDPSAQHAFPRTIGADVAQSQGYNRLLDMGEIGILRPGNVSTGGVDAITVSVQGGKAKIYLNDFTSPGTAKPSKATHAKWVRELEQAVAGDRLNLGDKAAEKMIRDAIASGEIYVRPVRVDIPSAATPGPRPGAGSANPNITLGKPTKVSGK